MENSSSKSSPKISTSGSAVLSISNNDCKTAMQYIKSKVIDAGKFAGTGSFIRLCCDSNVVSEDTNAPKQEETPSVTSFVDVASSLVSVPKNNNNNHKGKDAAASEGPLKARCRNLIKALCKYKSNGRTLAITDIANVVSSESDASCAVTTHMLPGHFNSNTIKKVTSHQASAAMRELHCKPVVSSITMTSYSYVFSFFVDTALSKRMITFPCNTQFVFSSVNEDVETFLDVVDNGLKCVHTTLNLERLSKWRGLGDEPAVEDVESTMIKADGWMSSWNESVQNGLNTSEYVTDLPTVAALLPAHAIQLLVKNSVL